MKINQFEDIQGWQKARELTQRIYQVCERGDLSKDYGLKSQICRAAVLAMSNIAEGFARKSHKDFAHFLDIARGSATEVQSLLYVALDIGYISQPELTSFYSLANETISLIAGLTRHLRNSPNSRSPSRP